MRIVAVDMDLCEGHGKCYLTAPDLLRPQDDAGRAEFYADPIDPADTAALRRADATIAGCPERALTWAEV
jgi:ferredoxin